MSFATPAELNTFLGVTVDGPRAQLMLDLATAAIQRHARQTFALVEDDEITLRGTWGDTLWLPQRPVQAVTSIHVDSVLAPATTYEWSTDGKVTFDSDPSWIVNLAEDAAGYWGGDDVLVVVVYDHGQDIPDDVKGLCLGVAARLIGNAASAGVVQETLGAYSVTYDRAATVALTDDEKAALLPFRRAGGTITSRS